MLLENSLMLSKGITYPTPTTHFTYDNVSGTVLVDEYGNNDGTIEGITFASGLDGDSGVFSGGTDYVKSNIAIPITKFSITMFVKFDNIDSTRGVCTTLNTSHNAGFRIRKVSANLSLEQHSTSGDTYSNTFAVSAATWYFIGLAHDNGTSYFYVNETLVDTESLAFSSHDFDLLIGRYYTDSSGSLHDGMQDEFKYHEGIALTADEMLAIKREFLP